jgi:hypothetical protein
MIDGPSTQRAVLARDAALRRLRRLTGGLIAGAVALSAVFAGVAASSTTHTKKVVRKTQGATLSVTTTPPLPPAPAAPAAAAPTTQAPVPTQAPPVAVSGGS